MKHRFLDEALDDIATAVNHLHSVGAKGRMFAVEVKKIVDLLIATPRLFSKATGAPKRRDIRVVKIGRFDYFALPRSLGE